MAVVMGVFPTMFLKPMEPAVKRVVERIHSAQPVRVENAPGQRASVKGQRSGE
jgi:NADH:ubiquinone oxidoreductase subunit 4 (subunit M)